LRRATLVSADFSSTLSGLRLPGVVQVLSHGSGRAAPVTWRLASSSAGSRGTPPPACAERRWSAPTSRPPSAASGCLVSSKT
jgi:hypothetical protein